MTTPLHLQIQSVYGGPFEDIDLLAEEVTIKSYRYSVNTPAVLTWTVCSPNYQRTLGENVFVRFWDENGGFDADNPVFEGWCRKATPTPNSNEVLYEAMDPTAITAQEVPILSLPWEFDAGQSPPYVRPIGAVPRLAWNVRLVQDPDYSYQVGQNGTVGNVIAGLLQYGAYALEYFHAAPDGFDPNSTDAFDVGELSALIHVPQDKWTWTSESIRQGIGRFLAATEPAVKIFWHPGERKWHFRNLYNGTQVELVLNDITEDYPVLSFAIDRSLDNRYTAVAAYGPPESDLSQFLCWFTVDSGGNPVLNTDGLTTLDDGSVVLETYVDALGTHEVVGYTKFQVIDPDFRAGSQLLPYWYAAPFGALFVNAIHGRLNLSYSSSLVPVLRPHLQYSFDGGNTWNTTPVWADFLNGIVDIKVPISLHSSPAPLNGSTRTYFVPTHYKLIWANYVEPLQVRFPASGFSGTAYDEDNIQNELRLYEEMLCTGRSWDGTAETTATRLTQYGEFVTLLHTQRKDVVFSGLCVLDGLDYRFVRLWNRVNFAGKDADGSTVTTGWEEANMIATDVEYDYERRTTTLTFSSDQLSIMGFDPDNLRRRLGIRALERRSSPRFNYTYRDYETRFGGKIRDLARVDVTEDVYYVDPITGEIG